MAPLTRVICPYSNMARYIALTSRRDNYTYMAPLFHFSNGRPLTIQAPPPPAPVSRLLFQPVQHTQSQNWWCNFSSRGWRLTSNHSAARQVAKPGIPALHPHTPESAIAVQTHCNCGPHICHLNLNQQQPYRRSQHH